MTGGSSVTLMRSRFSTGGIIFDGVDEDFLDWWGDLLGGLLMQNCAVGLDY